MKQQIIKHLQKEKACKHNKMLRCTYDVKLDDLPVRLFFSSEDARETGMGC